MKTKIHPQWFNQATVVCACGNTFNIGSTKSELRVEICNRCHPFFTGEMRFADSEGNVDRFIKKREHAQKQAPILAKRKSKKNQAPVEDTEPKSLKEMLLGLK